LESASTHFRNQARWRPLELVFWACALLPFVVTPNYLSLASQIAITALFALSLDLILGYAGIVSLGHAAFFGMGAYTAGLIAKHYWTEPLSALVLAAIAAGILGYVTSHIIVRFRHLALIMLTMGFGLLLAEAANSASALTGGADGLQGFRVPAVLGFKFDMFGRAAYAYALAVLFICFLLARRLIHSPFGLALRGIRENATRMPAIGAPSRAHLRKAYTIAAVLAGVAGALLTQTTSTVSLETLSFGRSADVLVILILGGAGRRLYGGIVGAIIYMVARDHFSGINPQYWYFWIGLMLVAVVMFLPNGILGGLSALHKKSQ
jgi:branched-chain amino acid transport system permease protein